MSFFGGGTDMEDFFKEHGGHQGGKNKTSALTERIQNYRRQYRRRFGHKKCIQKQAYCHYGYITYKRFLSGKNIFAFLLFFFAESKITNRKYNRRECVGIKIKHDIRTVFNIIHKKLLR